MRWTTTPLGEVTRGLSGTTPDSGDAALWGGAHVWVTPTDLGKLNGMTIRRSARSISDKALQKCSLTFVPKKAVVMSSRAPIGHLAIAGCDLYTNQGCKSFACGKDLDSEFLFFTLRYRMRDIQALGSGATFKEVSKSALEAFEISFPGIEQQRQIAARLKAQLAEVETARQAARGQVREASLLRSVILESAIKNISLDAKVLPIDALALNVHYGLSEKMNEFGIGYKIFRMNEIIDGHMSDNGQMKCANISSEEFEKYKLNKGDVLFNRTNSIDHVGKTGLFDLDGDYCFASYLVRIVPDTEKILPSFLALIMNTPSFQRIAKSKASKAINQANINATVMRAMTIPVPANMNEQRSIAAYLKAQLAEVAAVQEAAAAQLAEIERLPQRILARAFNSQGISP